MKEEKKIISIDDWNSFVCNCVVCAFKSSSWVDFDEYHHTPKVRCLIDNNVQWIYKQSIWEWIMNSYKESESIKKCTRNCSQSFVFSTRCVYLFWEYIRFHYTLEFIRFAGLKYNNTHTSISHKYLIDSCILNIVNSISRVLSLEHSIQVLMGVAIQCPKPQSYKLLCYWCILRCNTHPIKSQLIQAVEIYTTSQTFDVRHLNGFWCIESTLVFNVSIKSQVSTKSASTCRFDKLTWKRVFVVSYT